MRGLSRRAALAATVAACLGLVAPAAAAAQTPAEVDAVIARHARPDAPGCSVAVSQGGRMVVERAFGLAHLEHPAPNTPATIFDSGSVNKQFTAAAVLMLAAEGKLSVQDDIRRYLPEMPDYGAPITIEHLLTHTSGVRDWLFLSMIAGYHPFESPRTYAAADVLDITVRQRGLNFAPGAEFSYTNTGYILLGLIVERVSGRSQADFTAERIFRPLGMTATQWRADTRKMIPGLATSYERAGAGWLQGKPLPANLYTTAGDLVRWNDALTDNRLGAGLTQELQRPGRLADGRPAELFPGVAYARGLAIDTFRGATEVMHGGVTADYRTYVSRYPDHRLSLAVLCNSPQIDATRLSRELASLYLSARQGPAPSAAPAPPAPPPVTPQERWTPSAAELADFAGRYASDEVGGAVRITVEGDRLKVDIELRPGMSQLAAAVSPDEFMMPRGRLKFRRDAAGRVISYGISMERARDVLFTRLADTPR